LAGRLGLVVNVNAVRAKRINRRLDLRGSQ
jgi:hypothetical protein